jgi:nucleoside 2-deoxyribosyltransferase
VSPVPITELEETKFAFVLMPFDEAFDDIYRLGIKEPLEQIGVRVERVDEQVFRNESILERIYNQITAADFIIADMSKKNPNVFYEVGYAHARDRPCILVVSEISDIPFDLKLHRHLVYGGSVQKLRAKIVFEAKALIFDLKEKSKSLSVEALKPTGILKKMKYSASAEVDIVFDIHNFTNSISDEIEAIYFYTSNGWSYRQEGQECAVSKSDLAEYAQRHFLKSPIRRLQKDGWAQIKICGQKQIASVLRGEVLHDSYRLSGNSLVRLVTQKRIFDHKLFLDLVIDDLPF